MGTKIVRERERGVGWIQPRIRSSPPALIILSGF
jgi:hypothetical protein